MNLMLLYLQCGFFRRKSRNDKGDKDALEPVDSDAFSAAAKPKLTDFSSAPSHQPAESTPAVTYDV